MDGDGIARQTEVNVKGFVLALLLFSPGAIAQVSIPSGTILPVELSSSLKPQRSKPGQTIRARIMQDVPLSPKKEIKAGAKIVGEVLSASTAKDGKSAEIIFRFDKLEFSHQSIPLSTSLRALASMMEVEAAQIPPTGTDRETPWAWRTRNLIGGETAYGQGGPVARGTAIVGQALAEGVLVRVQANQRSDCPGEVAGSTQLQALWVFSSDACGVYGFSDVEITHAGGTDPVGQIKINSKRAELNIRAGSAMLLQVNSTTQ